MTLFELPLTGFQAVVDADDPSDRDLIPGTFEYIEAKIRRDAEGNSYGGDFEWLCQWFLKTAPLYRGRFEKVWLWKDWPGRWGPDCGIDLIARERTGELWAIQAKAHLPDNPIGKKKIDSFLSESSRSVIAVRLLMATTDRIGRHALRLINALANDDKPVQMLLRGQFLNAEVEWPQKIRGKGARLTPWTPKPYQETAIKAVVDGFRDPENDRGRLIMACGTGKTLTAMWIAEALQSSLSLVLVPSLSLVEQNLDEWGRHAAQDFDALVVCSDEKIGNKKEDEDAAVQSVAQLGVKPTTELKDIRRFLRERRTRPAVVFATYQSSDCVAAAQSGKIKPFDLVICDEAHRLAGKTDGLFATVLDRKKIKARKRLFMTATPRIIKERDKRRFAEEGNEVVSMDDAHVFGPEFHRLWFSQAMDEGLLTDYKVIAIGVTDSEVSKARAWVEKAKLVRTADGLSTDARTLAAQIGLAKAMKRYDLRKLITFHSSIDRAARFVDVTLPDSFTGILPHLSRASRPSGKLWAKHISGKTPAGMRGTLLKGLKDLPDDTRGLVSNCRCLSEGVDVKALDGVAFIDPRRSVIDVIQAVGRVIRKPDNASDKPFGYVIIPVLIDESEDADHALTKSVFDPIWQVLKALRSHDDRLASELDKLRLSLGKQSKTRGRIQLPANIHLDLPTHLDLPDFEQAFYVRAVELTTTRQFRPFEEARNFVRALGLKDIAEWRRYCEGGVAGYAPKPDDIPARPDSKYRDQGWVSMGDWLGTGVIAKMNRQYRPFNEARTFAHSLNLTRVVEWLKYCKGELAGYESKPKDIPANPLNAYRDQGWVNMGDWLGTGRIATHLRQYRSFEEARTFVRSLGLKNGAEWAQYCKGELPGYERKPDDIPINMAKTYRDQGWVGVGDWLGTGRIATHLRQYRPFKEARAFVRSLGLTNTTEWNQYCKGGLSDYEPKPDDIPYEPMQIYRDQGWTSMGDWLGTGTIAPNKRQFRPFKEARTFVHSLGLKSTAEWNQYCKGELAGFDPKPDDIPSNPNQQYRDQGWVSAGDWFGTGTIAPGLRQFQPFEEARNFVRSLSLKNLAEWQQYCTGRLAGGATKPENIPTNPSNTYRDQGWVSMGDWLGKGTIATQLLQYRSFDEARMFVHSLGLKSHTEWLKYCRGELAGYEPKPDDIPARPDNGYRNKGWIGVGDWLGTGRISNRLRHYRQFNAARMFVHSLGLKNNTEWLKYCRGELAGYERKPDDIPATPKNAYHGQGWVSIGNWLGTGRIATHLRQYRPFKEARMFVRSLGLKSSAEWGQYCKGELAGYEAKPDDIPDKPERAFRDHGWIGIGDWLGYG